MRKVKLVEDWRNWWRWVSQQCMLAAIAIQTVWHSLPTELQAAIPQQWITWGTVAVLVLGCVGRLVRQDLPSKSNDAAGAERVD